MSISNFFEISDNGFDYESERKKILNNLILLKSMSVEEQTLYKKWIECNDLKHRYDSSALTKSKIWTPTDIYNKESTLSELHSIRPKVKVIERPHELDDWLNLRLFVTSFNYDYTPGRVIRLIVFDDVTGKYLGIISLSSDVPTIGVRDNFIGWNKSNKFSDGKLNCISIASCLVATQPFGYNFLGGKLIASLLSIKYIRDIWYENYKDFLVGITTTSLYGINSMYNGIPYWKTLGESQGKVYIKPDNDIYEIWHHWLQKNKPIEYAEITKQKEGVAGPPTGIKQKIITMIMNQLNIKLSDYMHGYKRGVYFMPLYENTCEFLRNEKKENELILKDRIKKDIDGVYSWWIEKAEKRYLKLFKENRLKADILYYNKLPFMSWEETKDMYYAEVGR